MTQDYRVPVPDDVQARMAEIADLLKARMPPGWGFGLLMFTFGEKGTMVWASNADRQDMLKAMQEFMMTQAS